MQREEQTGDVVTKTILADSSNESVRLSLHSQQQCLYSLLNFLGKLWLMLGSSLIRIVSNVSMKPTLRTLTSLPNSGKWLVILRLLHNIISHNIVIGQTDSSFIFNSVVSVEVMGTISQCWLLLLHSHIINTPLSSIFPATLGKNHGSSDCQRV